ncbi:MAG: amidase [Pseudomonadota bacterium]
MSVLDLSASDLAAAVRQGEVTPQGVTREAEMREEERNPAINAICLMNPRAAEEAQAVARRLDAGEPMPLAGVPVLIKDNIWVKGLRIAQGSRLYADHIAPADAEAVVRLRQAGAVILGITACSEFACKGATNSPLHGITRNPVDLSLTPGGSSGGSVAAVAAGIVPLALGTDAGGSTRRPPAHTGLIGLKPTQDLIPYGPGFDEPVWGISVICPTARTMADISLAMEVLAGVAPIEPIDPALATSADFGTGQCLDPDVSKNFAEAVGRIKAKGVKVREASIDWPDGIQGHDIQPLQYAGLAHLHGNDWHRTRHLFDPALAKQIETGLALSGAQVAAAHQVSHKMRETLNDALDRYGFIATPTTPCAAWPADLNAPSEIGGKPAQPRDHAAFTSHCNHAGVPAISLPSGTDNNGRPLGLQLIGPAGSDAALIGFAKTLEPILQEIQ